jgi:hypothetical protein
MLRRSLLLFFALNAEGAIFAFGWLSLDAITLRDEIHAGHIERALVCSALAVAVDAPISVA